MIVNAAVSGLLLLSTTAWARPCRGRPGLRRGRAERMRDGRAEPVRRGARRPHRRLGLAFSASLAVLLLLASVAGAEARTAAALIAFAVAARAAVDLVLLGVQLFAIRAFCRLCL
jgi:hypothetical protein